MELKDDTHTHGSITEGRDPAYVELRCSVLENRRSRNRLRQAAQVREGSRSEADESSVRCENRVDKRNIDLPPVAKMTLMRDVRSTRNQRSQIGEQSAKGNGRIVIGRVLGCRGASQPKIR